MTWPTTLSADVDATTNRITTVERPATSLTYPVAFVIDPGGSTEVVLARSVQANGEVIVDRGALGTQRQAHSAGVAVKLYGSTIGASGLDDDIAAALAAADSPSGSNPFTTGIYRATVSLSSVQIKALNSSPQTLVAAVPSKQIVPIASLLRYTAGDTAYTLASTINVCYANELVDWPMWVLADSAVLTGTDSGSQTGADLGAGSPNAILGASFAGQAAVIYANAGNPTNGNGTFVVDFIYALI